jgi:hypothetical protein
MTARGGMKMLDICRCRCPFFCTINIRGVKGKAIKTYKQKILIFGASSSSRNQHKEATEKVFPYLHTQN